MFSPYKVQYQNELGLKLQKDIDIYYICTCVFRFKVIGGYKYTGLYMYINIYMCVGSRRSTELMQNVSLRW